MSPTTTHSSSFCIDQTTTKVKGKQNINIISIYIKFVYFVAVGSIILTKINKASKELEQYVLHVAIIASKRKVLFPPLFVIAFRDVYKFYQDG